MLATLVWRVVVAVVVATVVAVAVFVFVVGCCCCCCWFVLNQTTASLDNFSTTAAGCGPLFCCK